MIELRASVPNRPGVIAELALALGGAGVNILDMALSPSEDNRQGVVARVASTSFIATLPTDRRDDVLGRVRALVKDRPEPIELPYVCELFVWQRLP